MTSQRQNTVFITFVLGVYVKNFLKTFFMNARPKQVQTKVHFKNWQFLVVTYDIDFYIVLKVT